MQLDIAKTEQLTEELDPELNYQELSPWASVFVSILLFLFGVYQYYTAWFDGFTPQIHKGLSLAVCVFLCFIVFHGYRPGKWISRMNQPLTKQWNLTVADILLCGVILTLVFSLFRTESASVWTIDTLGIPLFVLTFYSIVQRRAYRVGKVPLTDWLIGFLLVIPCLYYGIHFNDLAERSGGALYDYENLMAVFLLFGVLEATRRSMGWPLTLIAGFFVVYAYFGNYFPGDLNHGGYDMAAIADQLFTTSDGFFGTPLEVITKYVFHFILFGVLATRIGLGQLFLDAASTIAGRFSGGPAKVSVVGSGFFGMLSGSSVGNAVAVGSLTIPAMIRIGYPRHFAAGAEAAASTGGQITPPIMGAAAFIMMEKIGVTYDTIVIAGIAPAFLYFFGMFMQVHFEACKHGLRGLTAEELPNIAQSFKKHWLTLVPLITLITTIVMGFTPYTSAFWGITGCIVVGFFSKENRLTLSDLFHCFVTAGKYALAITVAAAAVGVVISLFTLAGTPLKVAGIIQPISDTFAAFTVAWSSAWLDLDLTQASLFATLVLTGLLCILMGCGVPTTANYIIMATVSAPLIVALGVPKIAAHFFVFYFGILADITPPVALAAYATAGIANSNPFDTGITAFRLGVSKLIVPFVFIFSPALLIMVPDFTWYDFSVTFIGCIIGLVFLSAAFSGYLLAPMRAWERWVMALGALIIIIPGLESIVIGTLLSVLMVFLQVRRKRISVSNLQH